MAQENDWRSSVFSIESPTLNLLSCVRMDKSMAPTLAASQDLWVLRTKIPQHNLQFCALIIEEISRSLKEGPDLWWENTRMVRCSYWEIPMIYGRFTIYWAITLHYHLCQSWAVSQYPSLTILVFSCTCFTSSFIRNVKGPWIPGQIQGGTACCNFAPKAGMEWVDIEHRRVLGVLDRLDWMFHSIMPPCITYLAEAAAAPSCPCWSILSKQGKRNQDLIKWLMPRWNK